MRTLHLKCMLVWGLLMYFVLACASTSKVKQQGYAQLSNQRVFENEFSVVWKGLESALKNFKITHRDPADVNDLELTKLKERSLETDWIYSQSRDKYQEYQVNGFPRKKYLQLRYKYNVMANAVIGGTKIQINTQEEIEHLNADGTSAGYHEAEQPDSSLSQGLLEKLQLAILAAP